VIGPRFKLIHASDGEEELYDLLEDPRELHPLGVLSGSGGVASRGLEESAGFVRDARAVIEAVRRQAEGSGGPLPVPDDPGLRAAFRSLGYVQ
jgi:hypothetical protein